MLSMITASWQLSKAFSKGRNEFKEGFRFLDNFLILCFLLLPLQVLLKPGKLPPLDLLDHLVSLFLDEVYSHQAVQYDNGKFDGADQKQC